MKLLILSKALEKVFSPRKDYRVSEQNYFELICSKAATMPEAEADHQLFADTAFVASKVEQNYVEHDMLRTAYR